MELLDWKAYGNFTVVRLALFAQTMQAIIRQCICGDTFVADRH